MELFKIVKNLGKEVSVTMEKRTMETSPTTFNGILFNLSIGNPGNVNKRLYSYDTVYLIDCDGRIEILIPSYIHSITCLE